MVWGLVAALLLTGCVATVNRIPFPENEYAALSKNGRSSVTGQAFLKTRAGDVKYAAGNEVWLNPATSYSDQWYTESYLGGKRPNPQNADTRLDKYLYTTQADGEGRFTFKNIPSGDYYCTTIITWQVAGQYGTTATGGAVTKKILVRNGSPVEVILTR